MNVKKLLTAVVVDTVLIVFGVYYDIRYLTIGGIVEGVDAIKANPLDKPELAWGIFKVMMSGVGLLAAIVLCVAVTAAIYGKSVKAAVSRVLKPRPKRVRRV